MQDKKEIGAPGKYSAADRGLNIFQITLNVESISTTVILNCERKMPKFKFEKKKIKTPKTMRFELYFWLLQVVIQMFLCLSKFTISIDIYL